MITYCLTLFLILLTSFSSLSKAGKQVYYDSDGKTRYRDIEIPDEYIREMESRDTIYKQLPGWPQMMENELMCAYRGGVALTDLTNDGDMEIVIAAGTNLNVYRANGTLVWSQYLGHGYEAESVVAVADMDNDGKKEIALGARKIRQDGGLYLYDHKGAFMPGWPILSNKEYFSSSPALADVDGDSIMEIIIGERDNPKGYLHIFKINGTKINSNFPVKLNHVPSTTAAVGDIDNDGQKDIVYCSYTSLYAIDLDGKVKKGFPLEPLDTSKYSYASPLIVDLDGNNTLEIITATCGVLTGGGSAYVYDYKGEILPGWPHSFNAWSYSPPTAVEPEKNGVFHIYVGQNGDVCPTLWGYNEDSSLLPHFPIETRGGASGFISVGDIDKDNEFEILFDCSIAYVDTIGDSIIPFGFFYAYNQDGSGQIPGFPLRPRGFTYGSGGNLGDLNGDGILDLISVSCHDSCFWINVYSLEVPYEPDKIFFNTYHANNARDGFYPSSGIVHVKPYLSEFNNCRISSIKLQVNHGDHAIQIELFKDENIAINVFNPIGQKVDQLFSGNLAKGMHSFSLKKGLSRGVYFIKVFSKNSYIDFNKSIFYLSRTCDP